MTAPPDGPGASGVRPPDLRLAAFAGATWLSALAVVHATAALGWSIGAIAITGAGLLAGATARWRPGCAAPWRRIATVALLGTVCGALVTGARVAARDAEPLAGLVAAGARVQAELVVRDDPRRARGSAGRPPTWVVVVEVRELRTADPPLRVRHAVRMVVLATDHRWRELLPGQRVTTAGRLLATRGGDLTAAVLSVPGAPVRHGRPDWAQRAAGSLRAGLQRACSPLPDEPGGLLPGLVVGDVSRLEPAVEEDFRATGMTHLNAVSGANIALLLGAVLFAVRWTRAGPVVLAAVCAVALVGFVILVRPSPSVVRAAAMGAIGLVGLASGRPRAAVPALAAAVAALVLVDPGLAADAGFALSVLATGGLLLLAPRWRDALRRRGVPAGVADALAVPAAAQLACAPVVAGLSGSVSLVAVPANLLAVPAIAPATLVGVGTAVVSPVWPAAAEFLAWVASWPARWLVLVARYGAEVPAGALPWPGGVPGALLLAGVTVGLLVVGRWPPARRIVAVTTAGAVLGALPVRLVASGWPPPGWLVVACAVGQGDAIVVRAGVGRAVVVDGGPDPSSVDRCLRRLGVERVTLLVISHFHLDHVGGMAGVWRGRVVDRVVGPAHGPPGGGRDLVAAQATRAGVPFDTVGDGWSDAGAGVELTALTTGAPLAGTRSDANNNSLVLRVRVGARTLLLTGDAETEQQRALLDRYGADRLRADVVKVAHHGSAYQDPAFLDAVAARVALVSVGRGNDYGHPNAGVLSRLTRAGARVVRTDTDGDIAAIVQGEVLAVVRRGLDAGG